LYFVLRRCTELPRYVARIPASKTAGRNHTPQRVFGRVPLNEQVIDPNLPSCERHRTLPLGSRGIPSSVSVTVTQHFVHCPTAEESQWSRVLVERSSPGLGT